MAAKTKRTVRTAVIYTRISVDREDQTSLESQEREARALCAMRGWEVVSVEVDKGRSAFKENGGAKRPALDRVLRMVRTGAADVVVVWGIDRLGRNTHRLLELIAEIREHGGDFAVVTLPIDTSDPFGEAVLTILGAVAQLESGIKSARVTSWHEGRVAKALPPVGPTPFGYVRVDGALEIVDEEAEAIRVAAADVLADGRSLRSIEREWNARGLRGGKWSHRGVAWALKSPTTSGRREIEGVLVEGSWPAILDVETADRVRAVLLDPKRNVSPGNERRWMLAGVARCGCGTPLGSRPHVDGPRYICRACHRSIKASIADELVTEALFAVVTPAVWAARQRAGAPGIDVDALAAEIAELAAMYAAGEIDLATFRTMKTGAEKRISDAEIEPVELPAIDDLRAGWPGLSASDRALVVAGFFDEIVLEPVGAPDRLVLRWAV